ncbi:hypothetical protein MHA_0422 [Mannheimia haemolytica PHL213]|nr:hypothetical protein MHA_0422 [Mannheimia haemolytica PHL213]
MVIDNINFINNILEPSEFNQDVYIDGTILGSANLLIIVVLASLNKNLSDLLAIIRS